MSMHDFHARLEHQDGDALFTALAELRRIESVAGSVGQLGWPDVWS